MNFLENLNYQYFFEPLPGTDFLFGFPLILYFLVLLFIKSIIKNSFYKNKHARKTLKKKIRKYPFIGGAGLFLILMRFGEIENLSMRFFLYLIVLLSVVFLFIDTRKSIAQYKERVQSAKREKSKSF